MRRGIALAGAIVAGLVLPAVAPGVPPVTCGRTTVAGHTYIVRSHGPNCSKAISWSRAYISQRRSPTGFRCRSYGASVPVHCTRVGRPKTYFFATKP